MSAVAFERIDKFKAKLGEIRHVPRRDDRSMNKRNRGDHGVHQLHAPARAFTHRRETTVFSRRRRIEKKNAATIGFVLESVDGTAQAIAPATRIEALSAEPQLCEDRSAKIE